MKAAVSTWWTRQQHEEAGRPVAVPVGAKNAKNVKGEGREKNRKTVHRLCQSRRRRKKKKRPMTAVDATFTRRNACSHHNDHDHRRSIYGHASVS
jgi:translation initiation factor 2 gamma subunit (eIF-2gamma)